MSVVKINAITIPEGMGPQLEGRFAGRAKMVEQFDGFEDFQLLRPTEGEDRYFVYTRWASEEHFQAWMDSQDFERGHASAQADGNSEAAQARRPGRRPDVVRGRRTRRQGRLTPTRSRRGPSSAAGSPSRLNAHLPKIAAPIEATAPIMSAARGLTVSPTKPTIGPPIGVEPSSAIENSDITRPRNIGVGVELERRVRQCDHADAARPDERHHGVARARSSA